MKIPLSWTWSLDHPVVGGPQQPRPARDSEFGSPEEREQAHINSGHMALSTPILTKIMEDTRGSPVRNRRGSAEIILRP